MVVPTVLASAALRICRPRSAVCAASWARSAWFGSSVMMCRLPGLDGPTNLRAYPKDVTAITFPRDFGFAAGSHEDGCGESGPFACRSTGGSQPPAPPCPSGHLRSTGPLPPALCTGRTPVPRAGAGLLSVESMTTADLETRAHPIARFVSRLHAGLDDLTGAPAWSMSTPEQRDALVALASAEARLTELRLRVLAAADRGDVAAETAATSTAAWLAHATRRSPPAAHADVRLATRLDADRARTRDALADGAVDPDQARVIVRAIDNLPAGVDAAVRERAEKHLVHLAGGHDAVSLRRLASRLHEVIDPDAADEAEARRLEAEERAAVRTTYIHLTDNGDGTHAGRFRIPTLHAAMLRKALHALMGPGRVAPEVRARTTRPELMGEGFCHLLERFPAGRLPRAAGLSATVVVLLDIDKLLTGLGTARLDTGEVISAGVARRLACQAGVVPAVVRKVLDGPPVVLDVGR